MNSKEGKPGAGRADTSAKRSGRVTHDARGNPVWEWQTETGKFSRDVTTQRLKKLEASELTLEDTQNVSKQRRKDDKAADKPAAGRAKEESRPEMQTGKFRGFNPYDSAGRGKSARASDAGNFHPAAAHKRGPQTGQASPAKPAPRQSLQSKYAATRKAEQPKSLLGKIKSVFAKDR